jgi:SNF2 family DNA or RNA helicase/GNAT superfamily N-acetyltransferase
VTDLLALDIFEVDGSKVWPFFAEHHYMTAKYAGHKAWLAVTEDDEPVALSTIIRFPHARVTRGYRSHRIVVLPDFQGLGIGARLIDWTGEYVTTQMDGRFFLRTVHPRFGAYCERSPLWVATSMNRKVGAPPSKGVSSTVLMRMSFSHEYVGTRGPRPDPKETPPASRGNLPFIEYAVAALKDSDEVGDKLRATYARFLDEQVAGTELGDALIQDVDVPMLMRWWETHKRKNPDVSNRAWTQHGSSPETHSGLDVQLLWYVKSASKPHILNKTFMQAERAGDVDHNPFNRKRSVAKVARARPKAPEQDVRYPEVTNQERVRDLRLYPYQEAGVRFLRVAGSALVGDDMGTGKTAQVIEVVKTFPALVVCPNSVKQTWRREFEKWAPDVRVVVAPSGTVGGRRAAKAVADGDADVLVVNYEALRGLSRLAQFGSDRVRTCSSCDPTSTRKPASCEREPRVLNEIPWQYVVADEAHHAKNPHALQTRALWALGDRVPQRVAMTGTPIANSPEDLWAVMRFVSPEEYPAKTKWVERYGLISPDVYSGGYNVVGFRSDRREEMDKFFLPRFIRRTKAQVLPDLPPKLYERRDVHLAAKQRKAYDDMRKNMLAQLDDGVLVTTSRLVLTTRLRQLASAYGAVVDDQLQMLAPSSKVDELVEVLEDLGGKHVVVFAENKGLLALAEERLEGVAHAVMTGDESTSQREQAMSRFTSGDALVLLSTFGVGGEGVDGMQVADTAIFMQRPWSSLLNEQAEGRLHRAGQEGQNVTYVDLVAEDTIEDRVFDVLREKADMLQDLVHDEEELRRWLA